MKWYKLIHNYNDTEAVVAEVIGQKKFQDEYLYTKPNVSEEDLQHLSFETHQAPVNAYRDLLRNSISYLIFSSRLKNTCIEKSIKGGEYFRLNFSGGPKDFLPYWYVHLNFIPEGALDIKAAQGEVKEYEGEKVYSYVKPVLRQKILNEAGLDIFRIAESKPAIFVSEKFKTIFEENNFTGAEFMEVRVV